MSLSEIIVDAINAFLIMCLAFVFLKSFWQTGQPLWKAVLIASGSLLITVTALIMFKGRAFSYVMMFSACFALAFIFASHWIHKVILTGLFTTLLFGTEMIVRVAATAVLDVDKLIDTYDSQMQMAVTFIAKAFLLLTVYVIHIMKHKPFTSELDGKYFSVLSFPLTSALVVVLQHSLLVTIKNLRPAVAWFVFVIDVALFVSNMVVFDYIDSLYDNAMQKSKIAHANRLIEMQALQYKAMVENSYKMNKTKHDFKNFCVGLVSELRSGKTDSVIQKLSDVYEEVSLIKTDTGNIIETLIGFKAEEALKKGIKVEWDCSHLPELRFSDVDLAIILGNAIDNAVEATEQVETEKKIEVYVVLKNNIVVITIKNPVVSDVDVNCLNSTKADKANHGFGIISMKQLVDKYDGELIFTCENHCFITSIIMSNLPASFCN